MLVSAIQNGIMQRTFLFLIANLTTGGENEAHALHSVCRSRIAWLLNDCI